MHQVLLSVSSLTRSRDARLLLRWSLSSDRLRPAHLPGAACQSAHAWIRPLHRQPKVEFINHQWSPPRRTYSRLAVFATLAFYPDDDTHTYDIDAAPDSYTNTSPRAHRILTSILLRPEPRHSLPARPLPSIDSGFNHLPATSRTRRQPRTNSSGAGILKSNEQRHPSTESPSSSQQEQSPPRILSRPLGPGEAISDP